MLIREPWPHIVEDNFLEPEIYSFLVNLIQYDKNHSKTIWCAEKHLKDYYGREGSKERYNEYNPFDGKITNSYIKNRIPYSKEIMNILCEVQDKLVDRMAFLIPDRLSRIKSIMLHIQTLNSQKMKNTNNDWHVDTDSRLLTNIVYTDENNNGTFIGYPEQEIKPKANRSLTFCSVRGKTWHAYVSNSNKPRTTFNFTLKGIPDGD